MENVLSYNFGEIEYTVRQEIHTTSARLNAALDDLRAQIAPLQEIWTRQAAEAYRIEQVRMEQAAGALNDILVRWATPSATAPTKSLRRIGWRPTPGADSP